MTVLADEVSLGTGDAPLNDLSAGGAGEVFRVVQVIEYGTANHAVFSVLLFVHALCIPQIPSDFHNYRFCPLAVLWLDFVDAFALC